MNDELKQNFDRIIAARERLLEIRADRIGMIYRLQGYLRARLDDFFTNVDPIGGSRLADLGAEGSKAAGDMALVLAMFDGARLKIAVDGLGRFSHEASPNVFEGIGEIVGFEISPDNQSATLDYVPAGSSNARPMRTSLDALVDRLVKSTLDATEAQVSSGGPRPVAPVSAVPPVAAMHPPHSHPAPVLQAVPPPEVPRIARAVGAEDLTDFIDANPVRRREEAPSYLTEAPAPGYRVEAPSAPAPVASPAPSYRPEAPAPSYRTESPAPSYRTESPAPSYRPEAPAPSYRPDAPGPTFRSDAPGPSYRSEASAPSSRIEMSSASSYDNVRSIDSMSSLPAKPRGLTFSVR